jgi:hypothetical protein
MREYVYYNCEHNEITVISELELANYSPTYYYNQLHSENYYILYKSCKTLNLITFIYIGEL